MRSLGIALIVIAVLALPVVALSAVFGLLGVVSAASWVYAVAPILLVLGILLVVLGGRRVGSGNHVGSVFQAHKHPER
jgi:hypothetical protein